MSAREPEPDAWAAELYRFVVEEESREADDAFAVAEDEEGEYGDDGWAGLADRPSDERRSATFGLPLAYEPGAHPLETAADFAEALLDALLRRDMRTVRRLMREPAATRIPRVVREEVTAFCRAEAARRAGAAPFMQAPMHTLLYHRRVHVLLAEHIRDTRWSRER